MSRNLEGITFGTFFLSCTKQLAKVKILHSTLLCAATTTAESNFAIPTKIAGVSVDTTYKCLRERGERITAIRASGPSLVQS